MASGQFVYDIYCRCATNEDEGLNKQKSQMIEFAKQKDLDVVKVIAEIGSGLNHNRKGLREISKIAKQKKVDMILTKDVSWISRDYIAEIKFIEQIKNVEFRTKANFYDESDKDELFLSKSFWANKKKRRSLVNQSAPSRPKFLKVVIIKFQAPYNYSDWDNFKDVKFVCCWF